ncbi:MAG: oligosaccharide flippase family protein [Acidimicrobiales bacterium]
MADLRARSVVTKVLYNYASLLLGTAVGFGLTPVLIRHLGHYSFGLYVLIGSMTGFASLLDFGIGATVMRLVAARSEAADKDELRQVVSSGIALYTLLGFVVFWVAALLYPELGSTFGVRGHALTAFHEAFLVTALMVSVTFPSAVYTGINQGLHDYRGPNVVNIGQMAAAAIGMLVAVELGGGLVAICTVNAVGALGAFFAIVTYTSRAHGMRFRWSALRRAQVSQIMRTSPWLFIDNIVVTVIFSIDAIVVGVVLNASAVAAFGVTVGATTAMQGLSVSMKTVLLTTGTALRSRRDDSGSQRLLLEGVRMSAVVLGPLAVLAGLWGHQLMRLWVGRQFEGSAPTLAVMAAGMTVASMQGAAAMVLVAHGKQKRLFAVSVPEAVVNLALSVLLARQLGIIGVALGTAVPITVSTFVVVLPYACRVTGTSVKLLYRRAALPLVTEGLLYVVLRYFFGDVRFPSLEVLAGASLLVLALCYLVSFWAEPRERRTYIELVRRRATDQAV